MISGDTSQVIWARAAMGTLAYAGKIYAIGGAIFLQASRTVEVYDPATNTWIKMWDW